MLFSPAASEIEMITSFPSIDLGKLVPVSVKLSYPRMFKSVFGEMAVTVHGMISVLTRAASNGIDPSLAFKVGAQAPHVSMSSKMQVMVVPVAAEMVQLD